jgi:hypothetical protein
MRRTFPPVPPMAGLAAGLLAAVALAACVTAPQVVRQEDPAPLLAALAPPLRFEDPPAFNLVLDLSRGGRGSQEGFLLADRPGHARLEIPGPMGSTVMAAEAIDGTVTVSLPGEGRSWQGTAGAALPGLPFPLPASFPLLWELLAGTLPPGVPEGVSASLLSDGTRTLGASFPGGLRVHALFRGPALLRLSYLHPSGERLSALFGEGGWKPRTLEWDGEGGSIKAEVLP